MTILDQIRNSGLKTLEDEKTQKQQAAATVQAELVALAREPEIDDRIRHPFIPGRDVQGRLLKGHSGNPNGAPALKRAFVDRLKHEDADMIYRVFMELVCERNVPVVLKAVEYIAGKPKESIDVNLTHRPAELDLGKLSTEELENLERLVARAQGTVTE